MQNLTQHFTLEELVFSSTAQRLGIDNTPDPGKVKNLTTLANGLEQVRALLGAPMHIDSGYRCPALNKAVGGVANSAHVDGYAADFVCPDYGTPLQVARTIAGSGIAFDQCIQEGTWVHISFDPRLRHQALTATFGPNGATYTGGV
jgi:zinc D-Ala-D-Ala carboxypeptidase